MSSELTTNRRVSLWSLAGVVTTIAAVDVALIRAGQPTMSTCIRHNKPLQAAILALGFHLMVESDRDPIHILGCRIESACARRLAKTSKPQSGPTTLASLPPLMT